MLQGDFSGVFQLRRCRAQQLRQACGCHRARRAHLALAAHLGAGNRRVLLAQDAHRRSRQEEIHHVVIAGAGVEFHEVVQHGRDDAGCAIGGCGDHATTGGILFIDSQGEQVDPLHGAQGRTDDIGLAQLLQAAVQLGRPALDLQAAWQYALVAQPIVDALAHGSPDAQQPVPHLRFGSPGAFVGHHQLGHAQAMLAAQRQQLGCAVELVGQRDGWRQPHGRGQLGLLDNEAAAHRIVGLVQQAGLRVERLQAHGVGVIRQVFIEQQQVAGVVERHGMAAVDHQAVLLQYLADARVDAGRIDAVRPLSHQAQKAGPVGRMAHASGRERAVQAYFDTLGASEQALLAQRLGKCGGGTHRSNRVRTGGADTYLEKVENTDSHANT